MFLSTIDATITLSIKTHTMHVESHQGMDDTTIPGTEAALEKTKTHISIAAVPLVAPSEDKQSANHVVSPIALRVPSEN